MELPKLTLEQKWETAESNLIYFVVSGIAYAKSKGYTAEDFGAFAGKVAAPSWKKKEDVAYLVERISWNKQQFRKFQMEILSESEKSIKARMKGFGEDDVRDWPESGVTVDDYIRFFKKKWEVIADYLGLEYKQKVEGEWLVFTITKKK